MINIKLGLTELGSNPIRVGIQYPTSTSRPRGVSGMTQQIQASEQLFRVPGQEIWSPKLFAKVLGISEPEMASSLGVRESFMRLHPGDAIVQKKLGNFVDVFDQLLKLRPDVATAAFHMKNTPIRVLNHRTLFEVLRDSESEKALRYLQSISGGQSG